MKPLISDLTKENRIDDVCIVYHDFPLDMHQYARKAAAYAFAEAKLGRDAWLRVTEALYQNQAQWSPTGNIEGAVSAAVSPTELARINALAADPDVQSAVGSEDR